MLKPCPFCGGEAQLKSRNDPASNVHWYWVTCSVCKACRPQPPPHPFARNAENAENIWNDYCADLAVKTPRGFG
jgi:Lar family restriction alleviation protein